MSSTDDVEQHKAKLKSIVEPRFGLIDRLLELGVLSREDHSEIESEKTASRMNATLLQLLLEKTDALDFARFREALQKCGQQHVVNYLDSKGGKCYLSSDYILYSAWH